MRLVYLGNSLIIRSGGIGTFPGLRPDVCFIKNGNTCYIEHSVQELAVQRIAFPAEAASLLLGACGSAWLTTHCAVADTGRKDDPVLFGAEVEEQASMNDNNRRYFSPEQKVTIFREH
jgi:hypothetical protein